MVLVYFKHGVRGTKVIADVNNTKTPSLGDICS